ncbi:MAG: ion transporter [Phycisphaerae bacterium]|nr:ion transporter [Phycisphaerae bacterium]
MVSEKKTVGMFQFIMLILCIYVLGAMAVEVVVELDDETSSLLNIIDTAICFVFLGEFFWNLGTAGNKKEYLKWGWVDFVSSIPMVGVLRWGRAFRAVRVLRLLRGVRSAKLLMQFWFRNRARGAFSSVVFISIMMLIISSIAILEVERSGGGNIKTAGDAIWWSLVTITTVGYGDHFPITTEGRVIAVALMITGVGLFGTFAGFVASWFVGEQIEEEEEDIEVHIKELSNEIRKLRMALNNKLDIEFLAKLDEVDNGYLSKDETKS